MKKLIQRLLLFFIAIPLVVFIVVFLPQRQHLAVNIAVIILSALGALEFRNILAQNECLVSPAEAVILGGFGPAALTLIVSFNFGQMVLPAAFVIGFSWMLIRRIFSKEEKLRGVLAYVIAGFGVMIYPGVFMSWIIRMNGFPRADMVVLIFLFTVIANDSAAWAVGMLFGKGNRGIIPASPNKSIAGYAGGSTASILVTVIAVYCLPRIFAASRLPSLSSGIILGFLSGVAASLGDLAESALKRSSGVKDSGFLIPGRGGVLDSIDSIALAAPVFYLLYWLLFT
ncbi:MAG: phosphatidate cytidylyltransferase [Spirochaetaceae bacterium]|jgi:phosphatidate cytidylyltransferase|nr:phosphatidate cytidylyltransferase [Spirochaetaceae bacterium]